MKYTNIFLKFASEELTEFNDSELAILIERWKNLELTTEEFMSEIDCDYVRKFAHDIARKYFTMVVVYRFGEEFYKEISKIQLLNFQRKAALERDWHPMLGKHHSDEAKQKMRERKLGKPLTEEHKHHLSMSRMGEKNPFYGKCHSKETKKKIGEQSKGRRHTEETKKIMSEKQSGENNPFYGKHHTKETKKKIIDTKRKNGTFNASSPEARVYTKLIALFGTPNVIPQYKSKAYPFFCDFYISPLDLYIECNFHWTHGGHPFNKLSSEDIDFLNMWKDKSDKSDGHYYDTAIDVWTVRDVKKLKTFKENKLNYKIYYKEEDLNAQIEEWTKLYEQIAEIIPLKM